MRRSVQVFDGDAEDRDREAREHRAKLREGIRINRQRTQRIWNLARLTRLCQNLAYPQLGTMVMSISLHSKTNIPYVLNELQILRREVEKMNMRFDRMPMVRIVDLGIQSIKDMGVVH